MADSNCTNCHAQACYQTPDHTTLYTGDQYIDLNGPQFTDWLRVDFRQFFFQGVRP